MAWDEVIDDILLARAAQHLGERLMPFLLEPLFVLAKAGGLDP